MAVLNLEDEGEIDASNEGRLLVEYGRCAILLAKHYFEGASTVGPHICGAYETSENCTTLLSTRCRGPIGEIIAIVNLNRGGRDVTTGWLIPTRRKL